ncbi:hypothetical protein [Nonomuraea sp. NPDC049504]|uniref:hypothetical protein n=1 Tax=Nonomuraea sp. NPDC049504 TaxID=3154729 RepID=UPI0034235D11
MGSPAGPAHYVLVTSTEPKQLWDGERDLVGKLPPELQRAITGAVRDFIELRQMSSSDISAEYVLKKLRNGQFWARILTAGEHLLLDLIETIIRQETRRDPPRQA